MAARPQFDAKIGTPETEARMLRIRENARVDASGSSTACKQRQVEQKENLESTLQLPAVAFGHSRTYLMIALVKALACAGRISIGIECMVRQNSSNSLSALNTVGT